MSRHLNYAYVDEDGTGFFMDCPECHFFKNAPSDEGNACRNMSCTTGVVVKVRFVLAQPMLDLAKRLREPHDTYMFTGGDYQLGADGARESAADRIMELLPKVEV